MSKATFHNYAGTEEKSASLHYSQATVINGVVKTSGQGGWNSDGVIPSDPVKQIELAFENVAKALEAAHKGLSWKNVYTVRSYHIDIDGTADHVINGFRRYMPDHRPVWTCVEIAKLGTEGMLIEIEVEAHI